MTKPKIVKLVIDNYICEVYVHKRNGRQWTKIDQIGNAGVGEHFGDILEKLNHKVIREYIGEDI